MRLYEEFALSVSDDTIYRALKDLGFSHVSARPKAYKQDQTPSRRSKNFAAAVAEIRATLPPGTPVEVWFQDEMRVGQKNKLTYRWATKGSRPRAVHDQRTHRPMCSVRSAPNTEPALRWCCRFATPKRCSFISTRSQPKSLPALTPFSFSIKPDGTAPKTSKAPGNVSLLPLPPRSPELNPQENIWQFMRRTGCRTVSSSPSTTSSTTAATPGTRSSTSPGKSCPSLAVIGQSQVTHCEGWYNAWRTGCHADQPTSNCTGSGC